MRNTPATVSARKIQFGKWKSQAVMRSKATLEAGKWLIGSKLKLAFGAGAQWKTIQNKDISSGRKKQLIRRHLLE